MAIMSDLGMSAGSIRNILVAMNGSEISSNASKGAIEFAVKICGL
jgi:hypothetical protein